MPHAVEHTDWVLVQQDCDLAWNAVEGSASLVELRPVHLNNPPTSWGIRDARFLLDASGAHLRASSPAVQVTPDVVLAAEHQTCAHPDSGRRLQTWLGLRYDRPAVPQRYVPLASDLATRLRKRGHKSAEEPVRDVMATFSDDDQGNTAYSVYAVVPHAVADADPDLVDRTRQWLASVVLSVPTTLGHARQIQAVRDDAVSLAFLETSYALDVNLVSWPNSSPGPTGAVGS